MTNFEEYDRLFRVMTEAKSLTPADIAGMLYAIYGGEAKNILDELNKRLDN